MMSSLFPKKYQLHSRKIQTFSPPRAPHDIFPRKSAILVFEHPVNPLKFKEICTQLDQKCNKMSRNIFFYLYVTAYYMTSSALQKNKISFIWTGFYYHIIRDDNHNIIRTFYCIIGFITFSVSLHSFTASSCATCLDDARLCFSPSCDTKMWGGSRAAHVPVEDSFTWRCPLRHRGPELPAEGRGPGSTLQVVTDQTV